MTGCTESTTTQSQGLCYHLLALAEPTAGASAPRQLQVALPVFWNLLRILGPLPLSPQSSTPALVTHTRFAPGLQEGSVFFILPYN